MSNSPSVMLIGLPAGHHSIPEEVKPKIGAMLDQVGKDVANAGYQYDFFGVSPEEGTKPLVQKLKEKKYDGICIGFGVRGQGQLTVFFEDLVNAIVKNAPGTQLLFNSTPNDTLAAIKRRVPLHSA
eukprot:TRINITY_DN15308_c0_g1_i1.p1 TRINITY_DN15308_c0_g1~~TRINITY_DN15308_c0_g1_i1.p1  ORF type:complete len:126 (-),score=20.01 TRINITY_DN15308_c0_g1_i1:76-453(-)